MSKRILAIFLSLVMVVGLTPAMAFAETEPAEDYGKPGKDYVEGQAIVCLKGTASTAKLAKQKGMGDFEFESLMKIEGESAPGAKTAEAKAKSAAADSKVLALVEGEETTVDLIKKLEQNPQVEFAEPNYIVEPCETEPADPGYLYQWHLKNQLNEQSSAAQIPAADTNFSKAWKKADAAGKSEKAVIAVVDTGVDYTHPDLKEIMWDDGLDIPALKAMGGGKYGFNANAEFDSKGNPTGEKSDDPMDSENGHGTHCAGIIASQWNQQGTAGVNGKNIELMALRYLGTSPVMSGALKCYAYMQTAAENGVNIVAVNNSWKVGNYYGKQMLSIATAAQAVGEKYGIISCFGTGNTSTNNDLNTAASTRGDYVIQVGSIDSAGEASVFSCYGKRTVDVFAPGSRILSTTTTSKAIPAESIAKPGQYLPQIMDREQSWFYEDFEDKEDQVTLKLLDKDGKTVETAKATAGPGAASSRGLQLPLDSIKEGENFAIEMTVPKAELAGIGKEDSVYLAFQGGCGDVMYGQKFLVHYLDESGKWKSIETNQLVNGEWMPARLRLSDHNWVQSSQQLRDTEFLNTTEENITLRLISDTAMIGHTEGTQPVFRLDNVGFGKSAIPYSYSDGTSMATPMVTGLAGLLAANSDLTPEEIIARIKGGVNRSGAASLKDKSVSNGFIDAEAAFDETKCVPVLNKLKVSGNTAVLTGYFFGKAKGTLTVGGETVSAEKWTDREITFTVPENISGMQEVRIIRPGTDPQKDYGRNFFRIIGDSIGFQSLTAPDFSYDTITEGEYPLTSSGLLTVLMAAADGKIAYLGLWREATGAVMELYDIESDTWKQIKLPKNFYSDINLINCYSLTADRDKLYFAYGDKAGEVQFGICDLKTETWKTISNTDLGRFDGLVVYQNKLLAVGGETMDENGNRYALSSVKIIDPNTGKAIGKLPDMPQGRSLADVYASGDRLYVCNGYDSYLNILAGRSYEEYDNVMVYDGKGWTVSTEPFFSDAFSEFDRQQTLDYGLGAADNGLFAVGPVKNLDGKDMWDTWFYDAEKNTWSVREDLRYCDIKTTNNKGICYDGAFYILAYTGEQSEPLIFRKLPGVSYTGPKERLMNGEAQPAAPKIKAESGLTSTKLSWNKVSGATGYEIYRATSKNGTYKKVFTTTKQSWTNTGLTTGKTNYYKVRAYKKSGNATIYGKYSGWLAATPRLAAPTFKLSALDNGVKVTWNKVSGASGYKIYRATSKNGTYKLIKTAKSTDRSYISKKLKDKKNYYYKLRSYKVVNGKNVYSKYSTVKYVKTK